MIAFLQMRSQNQGAGLAVVGVLFGLACGKPVAPSVSSVYPHAEDPDLVLRQVAFVRVTEGRITARGTAAELEYRRAGGRMEARKTAAVLIPAPGTSDYGRLHLQAPAVEGEVPARRGAASGGVRIEADRGDVATAETLIWEGAQGLVRSDQPVAAEGPGYRVGGNGLVARDDGRWIELLGGTQGRLEAEASR